MKARTAWAGVAALVVGAVVLLTLAVGAGFPGPVRELLVGFAVLVMAGAAVAAREARAQSAEGLRGKLLQSSEAWDWDKTKEKLRELQEEARQARS